MLMNPWFIGIITGVLASAIFNFIINLLSKRDYTEKVKKANSEVVDLLLSTVVDKVPQNDVVKALLNSTAKKYSIRLFDMNSVNDTYDDLISKIYSTNFVSIEKKQLISDNLSKVKIHEKKTVSKNKSPSELFELRRTTLSYYVYVITSSFILLNFFKDKMNGQSLLSDFNSIPKNGKVLFVSLITLISYFISNRLSEYIIRKRKRKRID